MVIIDVSQPNKTIEQKVQKVKQLNTLLYNIIERNHKKVFDEVWNDPQFTPKEIIGAFGTDAAALFQMSAALQQTLKNANPEYEILLPSLQTTINNDGSVTVVEPQQQ